MKQRIYLHKRNSFIRKRTRVSMQTNGRTQNLFLSFIQEYPPITRTFLFLIASVSFLCHVEILKPQQLHFNLFLIFKYKQLWRLFTCFLYFGKIKIDLFIFLFFFFRYFRSLELESYQNKKAEMVYMLFIGASLIILISCVYPFLFLGNILSFMLLYIWSRRNPSTIITLLGVLSFPAPFLPYIIAFLSLIGGESFPIKELVGIFVGHFYYFCKDVYEKKYNKSLIKTPSFLLSLFSEKEENNETEQTDLTEFLNNNE